MVKALKVVRNHDQRAFRRRLSARRGSAWKGRQETLGRRPIAQSQCREARRFCGNKKKTGRARTKAGPAADRWWQAR